MSAHRWYNLIEAGFWIVLSVFCLLAAARSNYHKRRLMTSCLVLLAFGVSDLVEVQTGAWWRPWWLLVWKTTCLLFIALIWGPVVWKRLASGRT